MESDLVTAYKKFLDNLTYDITLRDFKNIIYPQLSINPSFENYVIGHNLFDESFKAVLDIKNKRDRLEASVNSILTRKNCPGRIHNYEFKALLEKNGEILLLANDLFNNFYKEEDNSVNWHSITLTTLFLPADNQVIDETMRDAMTEHGSIMFDYCIGMYIIWKKYNYVKRIDF